MVLKVGDLVIFRDVDNDCKCKSCLEIKKGNGFIKRIKNRQVLVCDCFYDKEELEIFIQKEMKEIEWV